METTIDNTTRLLQRHEESLSAKHWLLVNAYDRSLASLPGLSQSWHCDVLTGAASTPAMLPELAPDTDLIVLILPKSLAVLRMQVASLASQLSTPCAIWLVGPAKGGIKGGVRVMSEMGVELDLVDSARHCKLFAGELAPGEFSLEDMAQYYQVDDVQVCSYPGVFSEGRFDKGSELLWGALKQALDDKRVATALDIGCGAGVLSALMARQGVAVSAVDVSATAVRATERTLALNALSGVVAQSYLFNEVSGRFDWIITNPPFHQGREQTFAITEKLIEGASRHLKPNGQLWLVANRHLPYAEWLKGAFSQVTVAAEDNAFKVYCAER